MSIVQEIKQMYSIDEEKIDKMSKINMAPGGKLPLPSIGESITVVPTSGPIISTLPDGNRIANIKVYVQRDVERLLYDWPLSKTAVMGIFKEIKRLEITLDDNMTCIKNIPITIVGKEWGTAPANFWSSNQTTGVKTPPKTYGITFRTDLQEQAIQKETIIGGINAPDLMNF